MSQYLQTLFDSSSFMPHGHCYLWRSDILWLNVGSDVLIAISYFTIPLLLIYFIKKRNDIAFNWIFVMFALFIVACGASHVFEVVTVWIPYYGLQGIAKLFTAMISLATAIALVALMPKLLALPSALTFQKNSDELFRLNKELLKSNDLLESKVAEKIGDIQKNEEKLRLVIESAPNGLLMVDKQGKIVFCNKEFESLFGYHRDEICGQPIEILIPARFRGAHSQHRTSFFLDPVARQMGAGRDLYGVRKDATEFPVEIGLNPLTSQEGQFVLASIVDISKRKILENHISKALKQLQQKNQEMEQFVYTVSHDLKSPLVTSSGFLGILKEDFLSNKYDQVRDSIARLERANARMNQLINDLLQLSRIGRVKLDIKPVDVRQILESLLELLSPQIADKSVTLKIDLPSTMIVADRKSVYQVFENLIINALKYASQIEAPLIEIGSKDTEQEILFYVRDNGPGIPKEYHQKIFGLFQRLESDDRGTGVGLTIVSKVMQTHGGRVWVESEKGEGTTFWLAFSKSFSGQGESLYDSYD